MTNKTITPFCVDTKAENLSEEQIRQLHAWCLEAGARNYESVVSWINYSKEYNVRLFGIDNDKDCYCNDCEYYFNDNIIKFNDVRKHLGLEEVREPEGTHVPNPKEETLKTLDEITSIDKNTLVEYANILQTDITVCQDGTYRVFMETLGERDIVLKTDDELKEFVDAYQKLMKFID